MARERQVLFVCVFVSIFVVSSAFGGKGRLWGKTKQSSGRPWPMPQQMITSTALYVVEGATFEFPVRGHDCDVLRAAIKRYHNTVFRAAATTLKFRPRSAQTPLINALDVNLASPCEDYPSLEMDESYQLTIDSVSSVLTARSIWGILRGLETFSQLVYQSPEGTLVVNKTTINDYPRFAHRGILLDTSRHYLSKRVILQNLEAMAQNKFNVFHWHIVDDQSFPYQSVNFPDLSGKGAYDPQTHIYTQEDIKEIIEFARQRGIRVVPEFDSPGHSQSWGPAVPGLLTKCYDKTGKWDGSFGPINPVPNTTYTFLQAFMKELVGVFPDKYLHLGGDEVSFACWQSNPDVQAFVQKMGYGKDYSKVEQYYMQRLLDIVAGLNSGYIIWQEVVDNNVTVKGDTVVEVWKGGYQAEMSKVTKLGHRAILSSPWYLNYISYGSDWGKYYTIEPYNFNGSDSQMQLVIGGEACMWGEYVDDTNLLPRLWPRASAIAERLWSARHVNSTAAASPRLEEHRCRMLSRGIPAEPGSGPGFCRYELSDPNL